MKKVKILFLSLILLICATCGIVFGVNNKIEVNADSLTVAFDYNISKIRNYVPVSLVAPLENTYYVYDVNYGDRVTDNHENAEVINSLRDYYKFNWTVGGQVVTPSNYSITKDTVFKGTWTPVTYNVTYYYLSEKEKSEITNIKYNDTFNVETRLDYYIPIRPHYTFVDWYSTYNFEYSSVQIYIPVGSVGDKRVYPKWALKEYSINYNTDASNVNNPSTYNIEDNNIILSTPSKEGHIFKGWYSDENFTTEVRVISTSNGGNINLYPKWELEKYNVTFMLPNGNKQVVVTEYGNKATMPKFDKSIFEIVKTDVAIDNITSDTVVIVTTVNIWYVYLIALILIVATITIITIVIVRKRRQLHKLRYMYQSNLKKKGTRR